LFFLSKQTRIKWNYIGICSSNYNKREVNIIWKKQQFLLLFFDILFAVIAIILTYQVIPKEIIGFVSNIYLELIVFTLLVIGIFAYIDLYNYLVFLNRFRYVYRTTKGLVYMFVFYLIWLFASSALHSQYVFSLFILFGIFSFFIYFSRIVLVPFCSLLLPKKDIVIYAPEGNYKDIGNWLQDHIVSGVRIIKISEKREEIEEYVKRGFPVVISTFTANWEELIKHLLYFKGRVPVILFSPLLVGIDEVDYWAYLEDIPIVLFRWSGRSKVYLFFKKLIDIIGAIFANIIFSPFMIIAAIGIKLTSKGPVFFIQKRVGKGGKVFHMLKFRSMLMSSDDEPHKKFVKVYINGSNRKSEFKLTNDDRVTAWGKVLRKISIDEFPQFFNVLKGELSLVGPRPPLEYEVSQYSQWHKERLSVKQGVTGVWQVFGRARLTFDKSCFLDIFYVENRSLCLDLHLLSQTPHAIVFGKGAY